MMQDAAPMPSSPKSGSPSKVVIIVNYFGETVTVATNILLPVQLGRKTALKKLHMQGDDEGDNISAKNASYCELTGQYWLWKNRPGAEYYGSMHYRRFFDFEPEKDRFVSEHGVVIEPKLDNHAILKYGLTDRQIEKAIDGFDLVLPQPFDVSAVGCASIYEQYESAPGHYGADLDMAGDIISELSPSYTKAFQAVCRGTLLYPNNMFVLRGAIFEELNEWLFLILGELEKRLDVRRYSPEEIRAIGYIAERLFTVFVKKYVDDHPDAKVLELRRVFFSDTKSALSLPGLPEDSASRVTIAASCDQAYVPQLGALIASVFRNANKSRFVDFLVLDGGISASDKLKLKELGRLHPCNAIAFLDMTDRFRNIHTHSYFPTSTFYRLALPDLLPNRSRVLFIDTDVVVLRDVSELYDTDLGDKVVAAVPDLIMKSFRALGVRAAAETSGQYAATYLSDVLRMEHRQDEYFQAGVLLFDLDKLRQSKVMQRMQTDLAKNRFWFLDQDVLNKHLLGNVYMLDNRWNTVWMDEMHLDALSPKDRRAYVASNEDPWIVHFAGKDKPWLSFIHPKATYFWVYLRETHWYEHLWLGVIRHSQFIGSDTQPLPASQGRAMTVVPDAELRSDSLVAMLAGKAWRSFPLSMRRGMLPIGEWVKTRLGVR